MEFGEATCDWRKTNAPATRRCLVRILAGGIIGPYFFENEAGQAATVNAARYRDTITRFFLPKLDNIDVADIWFHKTMPRAIQPMKRFSYETFPGRVLSRFGDQN